MAIMVTEVYDALRAANVPDTEARRAAEVMAVYRQPAVESDLRLLKWMAGVNLGLTIALLALLGGVYLKLVDLAVQVGRLVGH
jgi:hypothetical protein